LSSSSSFNPTQQRVIVDRFVATSQSAVQTIEQDDASLAAAAGGLGDQRWLTTVSRGNLDREAARINHARRALADAHTVATDYVLDGRFQQAFTDVLVDLDQLDTQNSAGDLSGAQATLTTMKANVDKAIQLSTAPGLPPEFHSLMIDLQTTVSDFGKLITASQASDDAGVTAAYQSVENDATKLGSYNFDTMKSESDAFYKPLVDAFNSEMAAATA
jgi:hypothetical protein